MDLQIQRLRIAELKPYARNARTHSRKQIRQIAESIRTFGFTNPILIDELGTILAGHGRVAAAKLLDMITVPCVTLSSMTEAQKRAYVIADNKLALNAGWDEDLLGNELRDLGVIDPAFDIGVIGFSPPELDLLLGSGIESDLDPSDDALPPLEPKAVSRSGDLWILGPHLLYCGDARQPEAFDTLLSGKKARMVFTDPPYNVSIAGIGGLGKVKHREFAMASGEMTSEQFVMFLDDVLKNLVAHTSDGSIHFICMDWRHIPELLQAGQCYSELRISVCGSRTTAEWERSIDPVMSWYLCTSLGKAGTSTTSNSVSMVATAPMFGSTTESVRWVKPAMQSWRFTRR